MHNLTNPKWWAAAGTRAIKTMAQTALGLITSATAGTVMGVVVLQDVSWQLVLSAAAVAGLTSLLMSLAGLPEVEGE